MSHWSKASANSLPLDPAIAAFPDIRLDPRCGHFDAGDLSWVDASIAQFEAEMGSIAQLLGEVLPR